MARHINIPIFIPHLGCPNTCVFCNQRIISGAGEFDISGVRKVIDTQLKYTSADDECEIAYFGGSFTGIDRSLMINLLEIAKEYKDEGKIKSIRCSTRPDYIDDEVLCILKNYGLDTVELGVQSACDEVLCASKRGHTFDKTKAAAELIIKHGMTFGGQMMIGLPSSREEDEVLTAQMIASLGAKEARIYPTLVFSGTELCDMTANGVYSPLSVDEAVHRSANALEVFLSHGIKILRIGLCESEGLTRDGNFHSGPYHPAMGELVFGEVYYRRLAEEIKRKHIKRGASVDLAVAFGQTSKLIGHKGCNRERLFCDFNIKINKVKECRMREFEVLASVVN